jgi:hypothetical protein
MREADAESDPEDAEMEGAPGEDACHKRRKTPSPPNTHTHTHQYQYHGASA